MRKAKEQNPRAGEGRGVGRGSGLVITGQHLQVTGSPHLYSLMFSHPLLNWIWSKENLGDIGISSGTSCVNPHVPACRCPAERANLGTASPLQPVGSHCRHCCRGGGGGLEATGRGDQASGGRGLTSLLMEAQTSCAAGHPYCAKSYKLPQIFC